MIVLIYNYFFNENILISGNSREGSKKRKESRNGKLKGKMVQKYMQESEVKFALKDIFLYLLLKRVWGETNTNISLRLVREVVNSEEKLCLQTEEAKASAF